jgi:hypothetical protein
MLLRRDEITTQKQKVNTVRENQGVGEELVDALDKLAALQDKLIGMTLRRAMQQAGHDDLAKSINSPTSILDPSLDAHGIHSARESGGGGGGGGRRRRGAVSSECAPEVLATAHIPRVVVPKTEHQRAQLRAALQDLLLFSDVHPEDLHAIVEAFTAEHCTAGTTIMKQGEAGDKFYIVVSGKCEVLQDDLPDTPAHVVSIYLHKKCIHTHLSVQYLHGWRCKMICKLICPIQLHTCVYVSVPVYYSCISLQTSLVYPCAPVCIHVYALDN